MRGSDRGVSSASHSKRARLLEPRTGAETARHRCEGKDENLDFIELPILKYPQVRQIRGYVMTVFAEGSGWSKREFQDLKVMRSFLYGKVGIIYILYIVHGT